MIDHLLSFVFSVVGHGIVLHRQGSIGCANIEADSSLFVEKSVEFVKASSFSKWV